MAECVEGEHGLSVGESKGCECMWVGYECGGEIMGCECVLGECSSRCRHLGEVVSAVLELSPLSPTATTADHFRASLL